MNYTNRAGFLAGIMAFTATTAFVVVQLLQLLRVIDFPMDEILIYGTSLCIVVPFILELLALHYITPNEKKYWSHAALLFSVIYAVFVTANYVVQLATVVPARISGSVATIAVLDQTPHSMFWNYDAIGYIFMGLAITFAIPLFKKHGFEKWVRISFIAHSFTTPLIAIVYFYPVFSERLLLIGMPWAITAPLAMLMLALLFKKRSQNNLATGVSVMRTL